MLLAAELHMDRLCCSRTGSHKPRAGVSCMCVMNCMVAGKAVRLASHLVATLSWQRRFHDIQQS